MEDGEFTLLAYRPPVRGETDQLASAVNGARVKGAVQGNLPVVVSANGSGGVARCGALAMVPCGGGQIAIRRERGTRATAVSHFWRFDRDRGASSLRGRAEGAEKDGE